VRILLATEGGSDEVVAHRLIDRYLGNNVTIQRKRMPGRGVDVIQRVAADCTRAAYFGHFDILIVHFDMDDTLPGGFADATQSSRWNDIRSRITTTLASLPEAHRTSELKMALMTPSQATEAWLSWGREDESGRKWEHKNRHDLKRRLFGNPPRGVVAKSEALAPELIAQMEANDDWPRTLRWFVDELTA
jgi:hypothetical protein